MEEIPEDVIDTTHAVYAEAIRCFQKFDRDGALFAISNALVAERQRCLTVLDDTLDPKAVATITAKILIKAGRLADEDEDDSP